MIRVLVFAWRFYMRRIPAELLDGAAAAAAVERAVAEDGAA